MSHSPTTRDSLKKCFCALMLTSFLNLHNLSGMKRNDGFFKNLQKEFLQPQAQQVQNKSTYETFPQYFEKNEEKELEDFSLGSTKNSQQKKIEEFCRNYVFPENFSSANIIGKSWTDLMSEIYDPSKEFLVNIGFYSPEEGENIHETSYNIVVKKGEVDLTKKKDQEKELKVREEYREIMKLEKLKDLIEAQREIKRKKKEDKKESKGISYFSFNEENSSSSEEDIFNTCSPSYKRNVFFSCDTKTFYAPSIKTQGFDKNEHQQKILNSCLLQYLKEENLRNPPKKLLFDDFYKNYLFYCQDPKPAGQSFYKTDFIPHGFPTGKSTITKNILTLNELHGIYIRRTYEKLLKLLFENVDLLDDFSYIVKTLDFDEKRVSRLRKAINESLSLEDSLAFSLCALSFLSSFYTNRNSCEFQIYFSMFCPPFFSPTTFLESISQKPLARLESNIPLYSLLECVDKNGKIFYKFLSFKNTVNFKNEKNISFQSFENVNFSQGVSLIVKKLIPTDEIFSDLSNPFFKKALESQNYKKNIWLFLENYFNQDPSSQKNNKINNLLKRLATFSLIIVEGTPMDYKNYMTDILNYPHQKPEPSLTEKVEICFSYGYDFAYDYDTYDPHKNDHNSPYSWIQANEANILKAIQKFTKNTFNFIQRQDNSQRFPKIMGKDFNTDHKFQYYYNKHLQSIDLTKEKKEDIIENFLKITVVNYATTFSAFFKQDHYSVDPFLNLVQTTKNKIKTFSRIKKFYFQESKKIIAQDTTMMLLAWSFLNKKHIKTKDGVIEYFNKMTSLHEIFFPYASNYKTFCQIMERIVYLNEKSVKETGKNLCLEDVSHFMATELAVLYFSTYKNFFIYQGVTTYNKYLRDLEVDYMDPLFIALAITCSKSLVPYLLKIGQITQKIKFPLIKRSLEDYMEKFANIDDKKIREMEIIFSQKFV